MAHRNRFAAASALAAAFSLAAMPVQAHDHYRHWHHHDGIDGGDVLAGALILGGIAAIASAASHQDREDREPAAPPAVLQDRQGYSYRGAERDTGLDRAADICADAVERGPDRVDSVDNVARDRDGWAVTGTLESGAGFTCRIGNDGQVRGVNLGPVRTEAPGPQVGDEAVQHQPDHESPPPVVDNRPVWRGDTAQPQPQDDGRYDTSSAPDFGQSA
ncbi:MAG TPA: hypothetical protein VLM18_13210 [Croceibacterium sp.]|nr:hypothetical protein [Croceibacterium sp.]